MSDVPPTLEGSTNPRTVVWRFYVDEVGAWRWQQLGSDRTVLRDSPVGQLTYDACVSDAETHGYRFAPAQGKIGLAHSRYRHFDDRR